MKTTTLNNQECVIQARNKEDFQKALIVANKMARHDSIEVASACEYELWVHVCALPNEGNREFLNELYKQYKGEV